MCGQKKDKTELKAKKKKLFFFFFFFGIFQIPFQVGNSANSATFPRSRKITGPTSAVPGIGRAQFNGHDSWWKDKNDDDHG